MPEAEEFQVGRVTFEILRPVPIGPVRSRRGSCGPGGGCSWSRRRCSARREDADAGPRLADPQIATLELPAEAVADGRRRRRGPRRAATPEFFPTGQERGYHTAMEWRFVGGGFLEPGPATVWLRMRQPLVAGEEPTPLQRTLVAADVGNGISAVLDYRRYLFINVDLTVHLERMPEGEWVCVDAVTLPAADGIGTAESVLSDERGRIGRAAPDAADRRAADSSMPRRSMQSSAASGRRCGCEDRQRDHRRETRAIAAARRKAPS